MNHSRISIQLLRSFHKIIHIVALLWREKALTNSFLDGKSYNILNCSGKCEFPWKLVKNVWEHALFKWSQVRLAVTPVACLISEISLKNHFKSHVRTCAHIQHPQMHWGHTHAHMHSAVTTDCTYTATHAMYDYKPRNRIRSSVCSKVWLLTRILTKCFNDPWLVTEFQMSSTNKNTIP